MEVIFCDNCKKEINATLTNIIIKDYFKEYHFCNDCRDKKNNPKDKSLTPNRIALRNWGFDVFKK